MKKAFFILCCLMFLNSCINEKSEEEIFYELFPEIVDISYRDIRLRKDAMPPPPTMDSIQKKEYRKNWEKRRLKLLADTTKTVILIPDSIYYQKNRTQDYKNEIKKHFNNDSLELVPADLDRALHLDISKLKTDNERVRFEYTSKYPEDKENRYRYRSNREFDGILRVSRIRFDKTHTYGYFILSYYRSPLNGYGTIIFIKKSNGNWKIDGYGSGWVS